MIIKSADDQSARLKLLEALQNSQQLAARQKRWAADELSNLRKGIQGERDAAHYLNNYFKDSQNHMVLHDLRFVVEGETAQIDHLIINRVFDFFLLETKNFGGDMLVNEHGEFSVRYAGRQTFGIPSPIEQSRRHANVLSKVLKQIGVADRFKTQPNFEHVVLVHPRASIERPAAQRFDSGNVIKADQFEFWRGKHIDKMGVVATFGKLVSWRSGDAVREAAEKIARQHRPSDPLRLPDFMKPTAEPACAPAVAPASSAPSAPVKPVPNPVVSNPVQDLAASEKKRLLCVTCNEKISFAEGRFCWSHEKRFHGKQYCREHQAAF